MSAIATFELQSATTPEVIRAHLSNIWKGLARSVDVLKYSEKTLSVALMYCLGEADEEKQIRQTVDYLFSIAEDGRLYYLRDSDAFIRGSDTDYPKPIGVDDVFRKDYRPGMHNGVQTRYVIQEE